MLFHIQNDPLFHTELSTWGRPSGALRHTVGRAARWAAAPGLQVQTRGSSEVAGELRWRQSRSVLPVGVGF